MFLYSLLLSTYGSCHGFQFGIQYLPCLYKGRIWFHFGSDLHGQSDLPPLGQQAKGDIGNLMRNNKKCQFHNVRVSFLSGSFKSFLEYLPLLLTTKDPMPFKPLCKKNSFNSSTYFLGKLATVANWRHSLFHIWLLPGLSLLGFEKSWSSHHDRCTLQPREKWSIIHCTQFKITNATLKKLLQKGVCCFMLLWT